MRSVASPDADTTSYCPVEKSWYASSDVPNVFTDALQPVFSSNGVTQSMSADVEPSSAYPGHARMLTAPSPLPIDAGGPVVLLALSSSSSPPHAAATRSSASPTANTFARCAFM